MVGNRILKTELISWKNLKFLQEDSFKDLNPLAEKALRASIVSNNFTQPFYVYEDKDGSLYCLDGKHRSMTLLKMEEEGTEVPDLLPATFVSCKNKKEAAELVLQYSSVYAKITERGLIDFQSKFELELPSFEMFSLPGFDDLSVKELFNPVDESLLPVKRKLSDDFVIVPFSILDSRTGDWLSRKRQWLSLGFDSQETREDVELIAKSGQSSSVYELRNVMREVLKREPTWDEILATAKDRGLHIFQGASIFDPVLCELAYRWFCVPESKILDPFAGGSVRGLVASVLGHDYTGIDLRPEQVEANYKQAKELDLNAKWIAGDSERVLDSASLDIYDFLFSCPPYAYLEKYSDDPDDLSNMSYEDFLLKYRNIISKSVDRLKDDSFACFVVGDIRDKQDGTYKNFVSDTIAAFQDAGMKLYNEMILINSIGSMAIRLKKQFNGSRKCGKIHQNVLVFYKGDPKKIKEKYKEIKIEIDLDDALSEPNIAY